MYVIHVQRTYERHDRRFIPSFLLRDNSIHEYSPFRVGISTVCIQ